jgi:tRNA threonylcarbamoyladenosine biosynthesis protein TsaB
MSGKYLLCIDASVETASVAVSREDKLLACKTCTQQREHGAFLQPAIHQLLIELQLNINQLSAIAVTAGPGSYTGLRVAMASAKGLCYALNIPLITLGTLDVMTHAALPQLKDATNFVLCPMIDARRMEVFTALYSSTFETILKPHALILSATSFEETLSKQPVYFYGNGAEKWAHLCKHANAKFLSFSWNAESMIEMAWRYFQQEQFASLAYAIPFYGKEFHSTSKI